jgi:hypothetical protein
MDPTPSLNGLIKHPVVAITCMGGRTSNGSTHTALELAALMDLLSGSKIPETLPCSA